MKILSRIYSDYLMPARLEEYGELIEYALKNGYEIISVIDYFQRINSNAISKADKLLINRHDVDTDVRTARKIFGIEKELGVCASYYFRLKTLDTRLMKEINKYGSEASYHFEELATYAKRYHIKSATQILDNIDAIRIEFKNNFLSIQTKLGFKLKSVASHGDFANRSLGMTNHPITDNKELRKELGIQVEVYDKKVMSTFSVYLSDRAPPVKFVPISPKEAISNGCVNICMLTHPRQWHASWADNSKENLTRVAEGIKWMI